MVVHAKTTLLPSLESCSVFILSKPHFLEDWGYSSVIECLASMHKAPGFALPTSQNKQMNKINLKEKNLCSFLHGWNKMIKGLTLILDSWVFLSFKVFGFRGRSYQHTHSVVSFKNVFLFMCMSVCLHESHMSAGAHRS